MVHSRALRRCIVNFRTTGGKIIWIITITAFYTWFLVNCVMPVVYFLNVPVVTLEMFTGCWQKLVESLTIALSLHMCYRNRSCGFWKSRESEWWNGTKKTFLIFTIVSVIYPIIVFEHFIEVIPEVVSQNATWKSMENTLEQAYFL